MNEVVSVYTDGGCVGANPSPWGGTWAYVLVGPGDVAVCRGSGLITPLGAGLPTVSNNYTELLAAVLALERLPEGWAGTLYTDSQCTRLRLTLAQPRFNGIPADLKRRTEAVRRRLGAFACVLLDGHPTRKQLLRGTGKRGNPVSRWNVECDKECTLQATTFQRDRAA